jgi:hypothetical protein
LTFNFHYSHVKAHQDDTTSYNKLSRSLQLNSICDHLAKQCLGDGVHKPKGGSQLFPLEPIRIFVGGEKLSSETGPLLQFHAHCQLAKGLFHWKKILLQDKFKEVDWDSVHRALHLVPRLFQVWASKGMMKFLPHQDGQEPTCPSCQACKETCAHIVNCPEVGHMEAFCWETQSTRPSPLVPVI